jgi:carboxypeptidase C (cathepsin A)
MVLSRRGWLIGAVLALGVAITPVWGAQHETPAPGHAAPHAGAKAAAPAAPGRLPPDAVTKHSLALPGRTLSFTATAGSIALPDAKGEVLAEVAYVAYALDRTDRATRPLTFVVNGGPGASSAWLELGALGPWRLAMTNGKTIPSAAPALIDNADTWLDFTDLVFIDPPGTGYSRITATDPAVRKQLWSVDGDIEALAVFIRRWLAANQRLESPKFIVGESYGGFRGPLLAERLARHEGIGISGLVLISPALDMAAVRARESPLAWAVRLPSYAAAERERNGPVTRADLADVEQYAIGDYLRDLLRGPRDHAAVARMAAHVAALTGLDPALVKRRGGRIDPDTFERNFDRARGKIGAAYDPTITAYDPDPFAAREFWLDPVVPGFEAPMASAMVNLYERRLGWQITDRYQILDDRVAEDWDWGQALHPVTAIPALRRMLALDPNLRVLVAQGLTDLVIPYFGTALLLDQIPDYGPPGRLEFRTYPGGHMFYDRDGSRAALRADAERLIYR